MIILWLFPILFIIHDLEEITGFEKWYIKNKDKFIEKPKIANIIGYVFSYFTKKGMALAILEELILIIIVCLITINYDFYLLWIGVFIAYTFHLIIHIFQSIILKMYVPAVATSLIQTPICLYIIYYIYDKYSMSLANVILYLLIGIIIMLLNLYILHKLMIRYKGVK